MSELAFAAALAIVAVLYSAVGQAGGTGYVALMGLAGFAPATIKPTALALNVLVSGLGCLHFHRAGLLTWRTCYPFALLGLPFSLLGGALHLPAAAYQPVVGVLLVAAGALMLRSARAAPALDLASPTAPPFTASLLLGGLIGVVSGMTGVGGGIFLAPVVLAMNWAETRQTAAISAAFNLINSAAALVSAWATMPVLPDALPVWLVAVGAGGLLGSWLGARHLGPSALRLLLAALLLVAGVRMIASAL